MDEQRLVAYHNPMRRVVEFYLSTRSHQGIVYVAQPVTLEILEDPGLAVPPTFTMNLESAQIFVDELWKQGIKPSNFKESEITAQGKHLEDMRKIAFSFLDKITT